jgi:hypothetical protein
MSGTLSPDGEIQRKVSITPLRHRIRGVDQSVLKSVEHKAGYIAHASLRHDSGAVCFHSRGADEELHRDQPPKRNRPTFPSFLRTLCADAE